MADNVETPADTDAEGSASAEPKPPVDFAEVFERAGQQLSNGDGGAADAATTTTAADTSAAQAESTETTDQGADEEQHADAAEEAAFYSQADLDAMRPGEFVHLDMQRVPKELRGIIGAARAAIARGFQEAADARKSKPTERADSDKPEGEKRFTDDELYELAMEGPQGFAKAQDLYLRQALPTLLKEIGVDPAVSAQQTNTVRLTEVIASVAASSVKALNDPAFQAATGAELRKDPKLAAGLEEAVRGDDREGAAYIVELAARRAQTTFKPKPATEAPVVKPNVTESRATKAARQMSATAAARSTTRGPQQKPVAKTFDAIFDEARAKLTAKPV